MFLELNLILIANNLKMWIVSYSRLLGVSLEGCNILHLSTLNGDRGAINLRMSWDTVLTIYLLENAS